jgi:hypothetical protein
MMRPTIRRALLAVAALMLAKTARGQYPATSFTLSAHAIGLLTQATHAPLGRRLTEAYLTQPLLAAELRARSFSAVGMLNLEGATLRRGELDLGEWGEGYVDRRHPHAYLHELMVGAETPAALVRGSLFAGRGFVPFGSDDPMSRPFVSYPVDHHLAQILERYVAVGALSMRNASLEAATFGGDEPVNPSTLPLARRFGDSWSVRGTLLGAALSPRLAGGEVSASFANVKSPEYREGRGLDQRKAHVAVRVNGESAAFTRYALVELARTTDVDRGRSLYTFDAALAEGALCHDDLGVALRWERSDRPEEERLTDLFRSARPATDLSILGVTEWTTITGAASLPALSRRLFRAAPFVEVARITADRTTSAVFDPVRFYGSNSMWRFSVGVRVAAGVDHQQHRMGRYGAASLTSHDAMSHHNVPDRPQRCF